MYVYAVYLLWRVKILFLVSVSCFYFIYWFFVSAIVFYMLYTYMYIVFEHILQTSMYAVKLL